MRTTDSEQKERMSEGRKVPNGYLARAANRHQLLKAGRLKVTSIGHEDCPAGREVPSTLRVDMESRKQEDIKREVHEKTVELKHLLQCPV